MLCAWAWLGLLGVRSRLGRASVVLGALLFYPSLDLVLLQQLTRLVRAYLVGAYVLAAHVVLVPDIGFYNKTFRLPVILCAAASREVGAVLGITQRPAHMLR